MSRVYQLTLSENYYTLNGFVSVRVNCIGV